MALKADEWRRRVAAGEERLKAAGALPPSTEGGPTRPIDGGGGGPHDPGMEQRVARLEADVGEIKRLLGDQIMPMMIRIDERLNGAMSQMSTKADLATAKGEVLEKLAEKPGKGYLWTVLAVLVGAILAAVAAGVSLK